MNQKVIVQLAIRNERDYEIQKCGDFQNWKIKIILILN